MPVRRVTFTIAFLLAALVPAFAEVRILSSPGGEVGQYLRLFETVRATGDRVVIDGPCLSACTLLLSTIPNDRICVTPRRARGFMPPARSTGAAASTRRRKRPRR